MSTRKRKTVQRLGPAAAGSWLALLAASTLGGAADTLRAEVRADGLRDGAYRLVVQSYDAALGEVVPGRDLRPVGSLQRAVTADELREGVRVDLLELRERSNESGADHPVVVAWIEAGQPDLEFDARRARPQPGSVYGVAKRGLGAVQISLNRKIAA
jgi:hypothetical protein